MAQYAINISGQEHDLKNLEDFSFDEYAQLNDILTSNEDVKLQYQFLLQLFTGLPMEVIEAVKNPFSVNFKFILAENKFISTNAPLFKNYKLIDLNKITIGRYIDLEYFLTEDVVDKLQKISAAMYLPLKAGEKAFDKIFKDVNKNIKIGTALKNQETFSSFRSNLLSTYAGLFEEVLIPEDDDDYELEDEAEETADISTNNWGTLAYVYFLAGDDYLKIDDLLEKPLISILNYLTWKKEQVDKENAKQKQQAELNKY